MPADALTLSRIRRRIEEQQDLNIYAAITAGVVSPGDQEILRGLYDELRKELKK